MSPRFVGANGSGFSVWNGVNKRPWSEVHHHDSARPIRLAPGSRYRHYQGRSPSRACDERAYLPVFNSFSLAA
jgi:hypothetical protein